MLIQQLQPRQFVNQFEPIIGFLGQRIITQIQLF
jgi:hypothetical protein